MYTFNKAPKKLKHELFKSAKTFFDPNDKLQVKYDLILIVSFVNFIFFYFIYN